MHKQIINDLILRDDVIVLDGFKTITKQATFSFYSSGVVISNQRLPKSACHYIVDVKDHQIHDRNLVAILGRGYKDHENFWFTQNNYYETTLHEQK